MLILITTDENKSLTIPLNNPDYAVFNGTEFNLSLSSGIISFTKRNINCTICFIIKLLVDLWFDYYIFLCAHSSTFMIKITFAVRNIHL